MAVTSVGDDELLHNLIDQVVWLRGVIEEVRVEDRPDELAGGELDADLWSKLSAFRSVAEDHAEHGGALGSNAPDEFLERLVGPFPVRNGDDRMAGPGVETTLGGVSPCCCQGVQAAIESVSAADVSGAR